jgi:hypothetical protein
VGAYHFNGQYWAEVAFKGMKYEGRIDAAVVHPRGRCPGVMIWGTSTAVPLHLSRARLSHEMLVSENPHGTNLNATDNHPGESAQQHRQRYHGRDGAQRK